MKKCTALIFALIIFLTVQLPVYAEGYDIPEELGLASQSVYCINLDTGDVVCEKDADTPRSVASLTKMMTALLLIENVEDLDGTTVTAPVEIYEPPITGSGASLADIWPYETVTARTLLYAMMLPSGNEAAAITGYLVGNGSRENFYAMMNARAKELGCTNTNFVCEHGLLDMDEGNYSTAHDLALIAEACWQYDVFREVVTSTEYWMPFTNIHTQAEKPELNPNAAYPIYSTVYIQKPTSAIYRSYIRGIKTGSTEDAGRCLATAAVNDKGETYLLVVLGSPYDAVDEQGYALSFSDTAAIYDWIFDTYSVQPALDTTSPIQEVKVTLSSETDTVQLYPAEDIRAVLPQDGDWSALVKTYDIPESVEAPIEKGQQIGTMTLTLNGTEIGTVALVAGTDVSRNSLLHFFDLLGDFFMSTYFKVVVVLTLLFLAAYAAIYLWAKREEQKRRAAKRRRRQQELERMQREYRYRGGDES